MAQPPRVNWFAILEESAPAPAARRTTEVNLSLASTAPLPATFHIHNVAACIDHMLELEPAERSRAAYAKFAAALHQSGAAEVPLVHKLSAKEQGRTVQPIRIMFTGMAELVATVVTRAPRHLVHGAACQLFYLCADIVADVETSISLQPEQSTVVTRDRDGAPAEVAVRSMTGTEWIEPRVRAVYTLLLPFMTCDEAALRMTAGRFQTMLKQVCQAVVLLANLVRTQLRKRAVQQLYHAKSARGRAP